MKKERINADSLDELIKSLALKATGLEKFGIQIEDKIISRRGSQI